MERCTNHTVKVFGNENRQYVVSLKDGMPTCTCMSFVMNRNRARAKDTSKAFESKATAWCKHIEAQFNNLCGWRGESVIIPGMCPWCSNKTEEIASDD